MTDMPDPEHVESLRTAVATLLEEMATVARDTRFRAAAAMVRGKKGGRRVKDDALAVAYAHALLAAKMAPSRHRAAEMAAVLFAPSGGNVEAMRDRIRKKLRQQIVSSEDSR